MCNRIVRTGHILKQARTHTLRMALTQATGRLQCVMHYHQPTPTCMERERTKAVSKLEDAP
jgi:hypothetical protein